MIKLDWINHDYGSTWMTSLRLLKIIFFTIGFSQVYVFKISFFIIGKSQVEPHSENLNHWWKFIFYSGQSYYLYWCSNHIPFGDQTISCNKKRKSGRWCWFLSRKSLYAVTICHKNHLEKIYIVFLNLKFQFY